MWVPILEAYPEELHTVQPAKTNKKNKSKNLALTLKMGKLSKLKIGKVKVDTPDAKPHVITKF